MHIWFSSMLVVSCFHSIFSEGRCFDVEEHLNFAYLLMPMVRCETLWHVAYYLNAGVNLEQQNMTCDFCSLGEMDKK